MTHCPSCGRLWFHTINGSGCLTRGCPHSVIGRDANKRRKAPPNTPPKEKEK